MKSLLFRGAVLSLLWLCLISKPLLLAHTATMEFAHVTASPPSAIFPLEHVAPGDARLAAIVITNPRSASVVYTLWATATNADGKNFGGQLEIEVRRVAGSCDPAGFARSDALIVPRSKVNSLFAPSVHTLGSLASETACVRILLPLEAGNEYQDAATEVTIHIRSSSAEHNAN